MKSALCCCLALVLLSFSSCVVQAPKFTSVEKVLTLQLHKTPQEVSEELGIAPYNFYYMSDSETVLLYKYRVNDRVTLPFMLEETNGKKTRGRYANLVVTYDKHGHSVRMRTCDQCDTSQEQEKKLDFNKVMNVLTVTLPLVLVFLGLKKLN
jgi:hypothetical protein